MGRIDDLNRFYRLLDELRQRQGGFRYLRDCTASTGWPERGVYFFFEPGETRGDGRALRVTRVGTHAVSEGSKATLWSRLATHRGTSDGCGNHRGSIFRKRVGEALLRIGDYPDQVRRTWGNGNSVAKEVCAAEDMVEREVSRYIGDLPFVWLAVDDAPGPESQRAYIERNAIALVSNWHKDPIDPASDKWLGKHSSEPTIRDSGLWNTDHVDKQYEPSFLDVLSGLIGQHNGAEAAAESHVATTQEEWDGERLAKIRRLIRQLYSVVAELEAEFEGRKFTPDGHLVGSIGEVVAAYAFGLKLLPASNEVHDAEAADGTLVQIKLTGGTKGVSLYSEPVHLLVMQLANNKFRTVYNGPGKSAWDSCGAVQKNGQRTVSLSVLVRLNAEAHRKLPQVREYPTLV